MLGRYFCKLQVGKPIFKVECVYLKLRAMSLNGTLELGTLTYKISQAIDVLPLTTQNRNFDSKDYRAKFRIHTTIFYWAALWTTMASIELLRSRNWHTFEKNWFKNQEI